MKIGQHGEQSTHPGGSRYFRAYAVVTAIDIVFGAVIALRFLTHLSAGAVGSLSVAIVLLASVMYLAARGRERLLLQLKLHSVSQDDSLSGILSILERALLLTSIAVFLLLGAMAQAFALR
jgi:hypothetical protein